MRFSFIICTYNRAKYLSQSIESICKQTFDPNSYEILIVDNNSTDNTAELCNAFKENYPHIQVCYHKEVNQGISFARNRGIKEAKGDFIIYIDDDETIQTDYLQMLESYLEKYPETLLAGSQIIPQYETKEPKWMSPFTKRLISGYFNPGKDVKILNKASYPGTGHTIIKRELYDKYGNYNTQLGRIGTSLMGAEDKDMIFRLINNNIDCYYFPNIPVYHHIPEYKLTNEFFTKLTYSIGKSERIRTKNISEKTFRKRLFDESIKWAGSFILYLYYLITFRISKGTKLLQFRWNVTKGLLGN